MLKNKNLFKPTEYLFFIANDECKYDQGYETLEKALDALEFEYDDLVSSGYCTDTFENFRKNYVIHYHLECMDNDIDFFDKVNFIKMYGIVKCLRSLKEGQSISHYEEFNNVTYKDLDSIIRFEIDAIEEAYNPIFCYENQ